MRKFIGLCFFSFLSASIVHIGGEALYLKPCTPAFNYAISTTEITINPTKVLVLSPQYEVGYRLFGYISWCSETFTLGIVYTSYDNTSTTQTKDNLFIPLVPSDDPFDKVLARLRFHYRTTDVRGHFLIYRCNWLLFKLVTGIDYLRFARFKQVADFYEEIHYDGVGPELGFQIDTCSLGGLRAHALLTTTAFLGENKLRTELNRKILTQAPRQHFCLPALYLRLGISYTLPLGDINVCGELGYEMHHYFQLIRTATTITRNNIQFFFSDRGNFGLWGPYGRIVVSF